MKYEQFFNKLMVNKPSLYLSPRVLNIRDIIFPKNSLIYFIPHRDLITFPTKDDMLFYNNSNLRIYNLEHYIKPIGSYTPVNININPYIAKFRKDNKEMRFITTDKQLLTTSPSYSIIVNTGLLNYLHRYRDLKKAEYFKFFNTMHTVANTIESLSLDRNIFIPLNMPNKIPTYSKLARYTSLSEAKLSDLLSIEDLNLFMLFRLLTPKFRDATALKPITKESSRFVNFILNYKDKAIIINMYQLMSMVREYKYGEKITKSSKDVEKLLLAMLTIMQTKRSEDITELVESELEHTDDDKDAIKKAEKILLEHEEASEEDITDTIQDIKGTKLEKKLKVLANKGEISKGMYERLVVDMKASKKIKRPTISEEDLKPKESFDTPDMHYVIDKDMNQNPIEVIDKHLIENVLEKQIISNIMKISDAGFIIKSKDTSIIKNATGDLIEYKLQLTDLKGKTSPLPVILPKFNSDGTFKLYGNDNTMVKQRTDAPIRKVSPKQVNLSSGYGKIIIEKARLSKDDRSAYLAKTIEAYNHEGKIKMPVFGTVKLPETDLPEVYYLFARSIISFIFKDIYFTFNYKIRKTIAKDVDLNTLEKHGALIGHKNKTYYLLNKKGLVVEYKDKPVVLSSLLEFLEIDITDAPLETPFTHIFNKEIPLVVVLLKYLGFKNLIEKLNAKYIERDLKYKTEKNEFSVVFVDKQLIFSKEINNANILLYGLTYLNHMLKTMRVEELNDTDRVSILFSDIKAKDVTTLSRLATTYLVEVELWEDLFIEDYTASILKKMKEPIDFIDLLIRASELLLTDRYLKTVDFREMRIKSFDRASEILYKELIKATRRAKITGGKLTMNPYAVITELNKDATTMMVDDLNPISAVMQRDTITYLGSGGRSIETMTRPTRVFDKSDIGVTSEATSDSGKSGVVAYYSASPAINDITGMKADNKFTPASIFSISALMFPFANMDDPKRLAFISYQNKHTIASNKDITLPVGTGFERVFVNRVPKKFALNAKEPCTVLSVSKNKITVQYKDKKESYGLKEWVSKEESGNAYNHVLTTLCKKGDKLLPGDNIYYDKMFFGEDIFNPKGVSLKLGHLTYTGFIEELENYEDASAASKDYTGNTNVSLVKIETKRLNVSDNILNLVKVGDKLKVDDPFFTIGAVASGVLDKETLKLLSEIKSTSPRSDYAGEVIDIEVLYNAEYDEMTPSVRKICKEADKRKVEELGEGYSCRVSKGFTIKGKSVLNGEIIIKIKLRTGEDFTIGSKLVLASQLKSIVSEIFNKITAKHNNKPLDIKFSGLSVAARIVESDKKTSYLTTVLYFRSKQIAERYFNGGNIKQAKKDILDLIDKLEGTGKNRKVYDETFKKFGDKHVNRIMERIRDDQYYITLLVPHNQGMKFDLDKIESVANSFGIKLFDKFTHTDIDGTVYTPNIENHIVMMPARRTQQLLSKGIRTSDGATLRNSLTGQVVGKSQATKLSFNEVALLQGLGLEDTIDELFKARTDDIGANQALHRMTELGMTPDLNVLREYSTGSHTKKAWKWFLMAGHIKADI